MDTGELIRLLAEGCEPIRPLPRPWTRTAEWLVVALLYVALIAFVVSPRADLGAKIFDWHFVVEQVLALATGIAAAVAALATIIPGYSRKLLALPLLSLSIWFASFGQAYVQDNLPDRVRPDPDALALHPVWYCFPAIVLVGLVPAIAMTMRLRGGAPLGWHVTAAFVGRAAAVIGGFGLRLLLAQYASLMV